MEFKPKKYNLLKLKNYIISEKKFIIYNIINLNSYNFKNIEKKLKISNKLIFNSFKNSIFKNILVLINSPIIFSNKLDVNYKLSFIGLKLNNKIYSKKDLKDLNKINYKKSFYIFNKKLSLLLKKSFNILTF